MIFHGTAPNKLVREDRSGSFADSSTGCNDPIFLGYAHGVRPRRLLKSNLSMVRNVYS